MNVIGVHSRAEGGKDTLYTIAAGILQDARRTGFADKMKASAAAALGFHGSVESCVAFCNDLKHPAAKIKITVPGRGIRQFSGREYLQWFGTEAHRHIFGENFWVDEVLPAPEPGRALIDSPDTKLAWRYPDTRWLFITDVRFPSEATRVLDLGGQVWKIDADERLGPLSDGHASEAELPPELVTLIIDNNGTLDEFAVGVRTALASVVA